MLAGMWLASGERRASRSKVGGGRVFSFYPGGVKGLAIAAVGERKERSIAGGPSSRKGTSAFPKRFARFEQRNFQNEL